MNATQGFEFFKNLISRQFCYYRKNLSDLEQKAYDRIREGFLSYSVKIPVFGLTVAQIQNILEIIKQDNPWLFYVETAEYQYISTLKTGYIIPKYRFSKKDVNATLLALVNKCSSFAAILKNKSDLEKEIEIHDYICKNVRYDYDFAASSFECVGPLLFGKGVCEGISKATKLLLDLADIDSLLVNGKSTQQHHNSSALKSDLHTWNIIKINGRNYHLDVTFDLTIQAFNTVRYDYFNLSDTEINFDHLIISTHIPQCPSSYNYYGMRGLFIQTQSIYRKFLQQKVKQKQKDIVFKLPHSDDVNVTKNKIMYITSEVLCGSFLFPSQYQFVSNDSQFVFHLHLS